MNRDTGVWAVLYVPADQRSVFLLQQLDPRSGAPLLKGGPLSLFVLHCRAQQLWGGASSEKYRFYITITGCQNTFSVIL